MGNAVSAHDFYENALGEMINGLFKTEATHSNAPWRILEEVEFALLESVDWFNHR